MDETLLKARLEAVRTQLAAASDGRYAPPRVIAVTKTHPAGDILPLAALGQREIGENRVQEIMEKLPDIGEKFDIHLIGRLQSNKVKYIIDKVAMIQSVDRLSLAQEIDRQGQRHGVQAKVLVQVSPAGEEQKGGMPPEEVEGFLREMRSYPNIHVEGLMAIMPLGASEEELDRLFGNMRALFEQMRDLNIDGVEMRELSMGMSNDYRIAARNGATMVRVGTALYRRD